MQTTELAWLWGLLTTLAGGLVFLIWVLTDGDSHRERLAIRAGQGTALVLAMAAGLAEWWLYTRVDHTWGAFMICPSVAIGVLLAWKGGKTVCRRLGGGQKDEAQRETPIEVENATMEGQNDIWHKLRDLPHFRETLGGNLINLATGDCLQWRKLHGQKCIEINLGGRIGILGSRFETLTKYLAVQNGMAKILVP
jgi:hypothetical protein